jgi:hypothetical protein
MKKLLLAVALGTVLAAPVFAQHDPNDPNNPSVHRRVRAFDQQQSKVPSDAGDIYYGRNRNLNPDFQLGRSWWKRYRRRPVEATSRS